jgi:hypothetical protein
MIGALGGAFSFRPLRFVEVVLILRADGSERRDQEMMTAALDYKGIVVDVLDPADSGMDATELVRCAAALEKAAGRRGIVVSVRGHQRVSLPPPLTRMLAALLRELADGRTVAVMATAEEVSTGVAARMLGFSRPHVVTLMDTGRLKGRRVNKHRRVRLASVIAFKHEMDRRDGLLRELTALSQEMGLYDIPEPESRNA